jgi:hypothetical protein
MTEAELKQLDRLLAALDAIELAVDHLQRTVDALFAGAEDVVISEAGDPFAQAGREG